MSNSKKNVLFIGAGRMAQALIEGLNKNKFAILVGNNGNEERLHDVREIYDVETTDYWQQEVSMMDIIILAMPPESHDSILADLVDLVHGQLIITVAAGIGPTYLESKLPKGTAVAWVMPNTAAKLGKSMTLYALGQNVKQVQQDWIEALIYGIGEFEKVTEQQIHELTAVTGSAPAFIYRVAEALEKITMESGVSQEQARKLVANMIAGSAEMLKTNADPAELADEVATPGGSTAAGLEVLDTNHLDHLMIDAIEACRQKAMVQD
ncbi:pyrroline-5-carboxylate reductase [Neobacillus cucumis]|uniref:pyrroline-5-carboxylate reductase n=1 Tax=Neobacillus cucumis TaxID=1740721 RepID=UPI0018E043B4|nr:pyrroline-5-carboxylate reductase [Neobacillus cucumis]MBI0579194.1 pyrroline-5-carboxylate reductase [Neobacillus cucumis]WHY89720.1 pyrroline-5-carboxylate reductase [Neobacillus cucumis]